MQGENGHAVFEKKGRGFGLNVADGDDEVGVEVQDLFQVGRGEAAHFGQVAHLLGAAGKAAYADESVERAQRVQNFRSLCGQTDNASRIVRHDVFPP